MKAEHIRIKEIAVVGFALFAMFFGAGNLIFPTFIGFAFGDNWFFGFLGFSLAGVLLPLLAVIATIKAGGSLEHVGNKVFPKFGEIYGFVLITFVGILFIIPRTGATTYEMAIRPIHSGIWPAIFATIFFSLNVFFSINPSKILDKIGKILTPILLTCLSIMIIKGIIAPIDSPVENTLDVTNVFASSFITGYQTADALAGLLFTGIVISTFTTKGIIESKTQQALASKATLIAITGLVLVYASLAYLGATVSGVYDTEMEKTAITTNIANYLMGDTGSSVFGVIVAFACLTTATGVTSAAATFFERITKNRISYRKSVVLISLLGGVLAVNGVESLINISMPILLVCYPVAIVLIFCWLLYNLLPNDGFFFGAVFTTVIISTIDTLRMLGVDIGELESLVSSMPLADYGFSWLTPAILGGMASTLFYKKGFMLTKESRNRSRLSNE